VETFDYTAIDKLGKRLSGSISASSAREARDQLRGRALTLTELKAAKQKGASRLTYERNISHKDLTQASRQLAILIDAAKARASPKLWPPTPKPLTHYSSLWWRQEKLLVGLLP